MSAASRDHHGRKSRSAPGTAAQPCGSCEGSQVGPEDLLQIIFEDGRQWPGNVKAMAWDASMAQPHGRLAPSPRQGRWEVSHLSLSLSLAASLSLKALMAALWPGSLSLRFNSLAWQLSTALCPLCSAQLPLSSPPPLLMAAKTRTYTLNTPTMVNS